MNQTSQYEEKVCAYCVNWVSKDQPHRREVLSWVTPPPNSDSPVLRVYTTRLAHEVCIQKQLAGIPADQPELFSDPYEPLGARYSSEQAISQD